MIKINLLPEELRKEDLAKKINLSDFLIFPFILFALAVIINLILGVTLIYVKVRLNAVKNDWKSFYPTYKPVEEIKNKIKLTDERMVFFDEMKGSQISWSQKLNILSDDLPNGLWFRKLKIKDDGSICVDGSIVSQEEDEVTILNRFNSNLRKNEAFFKDFKDMEIKSLDNRNIRNLEVKDFTLEFYVK